jgi:ribosomal protein L11 methyltransferase
LSWLEVALLVDAELVEPVAELFSRYATGGVALEQMAGSGLNPTLETKITVRAYIPQNEQQEDRKRLIEEGLWHLSQISSLPDPEFQIISEEDWSTTWRKNYHPIPIGSSLLVLPAWVEKPQEDRKLIILEPGMAFGTGAHPTTKMCLLAIEETCQPGDTIIDLGCGSGILSIAAIRCGAARALAFDIDREAIDSARANLILNELTDRVHLAQGSLAEAKQLCPPEGVPLLVANILAPVLIELLGLGLDGLLTDQGVLILSGILEEQLAEVVQAAERRGLHEATSYQEGDWRAVVFQKTKAPLQ